MNLHDDAEARVLLIPEGLLIPDDVLGINRPAHQEMKEWRKKKESTAFFRREREAPRPFSVIAPGGSVRGERANFTRLVLGCIEAKFCK